MTTSASGIEGLETTDQALEKLREIVESWGTHVERGDRLVMVECMTCRASVSWDHTLQSAKLLTHYAHCGYIQAVELLGVIEDMFAQPQPCEAQHETHPSVLCSLIKGHPGAHDFGNEEYETPVIAERPKSTKLIQAAQQVDWVQVMRNNGHTPCFHLDSREGGSFCLRPELWEGHGRPRLPHVGHRFVSLADLLEHQQPDHQPLLTPKEYRRTKRYLSQFADGFAEEFERDEISPIVGKIRAWLAEQKHEDVSS